MIPSGVYLDGSRYAGASDRFHLPELPEHARAAKAERMRRIERRLRARQRDGRSAPHNPTTLSA